MKSPADLIDAFRTQSRACAELKSPLMAALLNQAGKELHRAGSICGLLASWPGDPVADAVPLRLAAALHALARLIQRGGELVLTAVHNTT